MAKASRKQLAALKKARAAKRRYAKAPRRRARGASEEAKARKVTVRRGTRGRFLKRKVRGYTHEARRRGARRRRHYAREMAAAAPRRRRRRSGKRRHYVKGHYSHEARRRHGRRRRHYAREFAAQARGRRRHHSRRYRGALENPLSGMELAITILTGSVGYMAAEIADRMMAIRDGAPNVMLAVNGGKAPQLPMYDDWPRLLVAAGITGAPLVASAFIKSPTWRSALQTMGIGAGLRTVGNILVGVAAQLTMPAKDKPQTEAEAKKNIFAFEQSLENAYAAVKEAAKKDTGTQGLPQGTGVCATCKRTDGLGACCGRQSAGPPQQQAPLPPPPPITATPEPSPPVVSMTPPMVPQAPPPPYSPPAITPPPVVTFQPPAVTPRVPGSTLPGPTMGPSPTPQFAPSLPAPPVGVRGVPRRFMVGTGTAVPRPKWNWGHQGSAEDSAE